MPAQPVQNWTKVETGPTDVQVWIPEGPTNLGSPAVNANTIRNIAKVGGVTVAKDAKGPDIAEAIRRHVRATGPIVRDAAPAPAPAPAPAAAAAKDPAPAPAAPAAPAAAPDGLGAMLAELIGPHVAGKVDADQVRAIVEDATKDLRRPLEITVGERPAVSLPGDTHPMLGKLVTVVATRAATKQAPCLVGPAGSGKTTLARQLGKVYESRRVVVYSCSPVPSAHEIFGYCDATGSYVEPGPADVIKNGGVLVLDEIDAVFPGDGVKLNNLIAAAPGDPVEFPNGTFAKHPDCIIVAAANTFGSGATAVYSARSKMDEATRNRFVFLTVGYSEAVEDAWAEGICRDAAAVWVPRIRKWRAAMEAAGLERVISPRNTAAAVAFAAEGWTDEEILSSAVLPGWTDDERRKVGAPVAS